MVQTMGNGSEGLTLKGHAQFLVEDHRQRPHRTGARKRARHSSSSVSRRQCPRWIHGVVPHPTGVSLSAALSTFSR
jgi:hypothetical protein